jgi:hypothetical protein
VNQPQKESHALLRQHQQLRRTNGHKWRSLS